MAEDSRIRELLNGLREMPTLVAALRFEELVFSILDAEAERDGKQGILRRGADRDSGIDGMLPDGIGALAGPVGVSVKYFTPDSGPARNKIAKTVDQLTVLKGQKSYTSLLLVHNLDTFTHAWDRLGDGGRESSRPMSIVVWGVDDLERIGLRHPTLVAVPPSTLSRKSLERTLDPEKTNWRGVGNNNLRELTRLYQEEGVSVFLGAGISAGLGLPTWKVLIGSLFTAAMKSHASNLAPEEVGLLIDAVSQLNGNSPLQTARYLRNMLDDTSLFFSELAAALYSDYDPRRASELLNAVSDLCLARRTGPGVHSVVTYNFDDLLEDSLHSQNLPFRSVYHGNHVPGRHELPIYHVHGFLPREHSTYDQLDEGLVAFSEEGYHRLYADPYHWTNIVQLNAFRERTCLFLGMSMGDPNLRRLLEIGAQGAEAPRHYAFIKRTEVHEIKKEKSELERMDTTRAREFLEMHHAVQENVMKELGINVIWFSSFDQMPAALRRIMHSR